MRLSTEEIAAIKTAAADAFGPGAVVRLYGSRVHDHLRGGDIDLHVEVDDNSEEWKQRGVFEDRLFALTEPRRVDLLIGVRGGEPSPIERIALRDGVIL